MYEDLITIRPLKKGNSLLIHTAILPTISFHNDDGEVFASINVNEEGKLEVQTKLDFAEAGKGSAKVFWKAFDHYLKEAWDKWVKQNPLNT